nr:penicillin-binding transpeptidase domain-containing protein [Lysinibacter cavernae]
MVIFVMFLALMTSSTIIQVGAADELRADPRNTRTRYASFDVERGAILVGGQAVAQSVPTDDEFKFTREYPQGPLYSAITGYYTLNQGMTGIESALNAELSGTSNSQFIDKLTRIITGQKPQGDSVELTINPVVQQAAWDALGDMTGAVVAMDPSTGKILALVSKPTFDPNSLTGNDDKQIIETYNSLLNDPTDPLINRAINGGNHPGSTFKLVTTTSALESGDYTPQSTFPNTGQYQLPQSSSIVRNSWLGTCGPGATTTLATGLMSSCNTPFAQLGVELGSEALADTAESFGFDTELNIPLPVTPGFIPRVQNAPQTALSAIGQQDVMATPLQMAMVSMAIANDGQLMKPQLVDSVVNSDNLATVSEFKPEVFSTPMSAETAEEITQMMISVVSNAAGSATTARIDGVNVAGKTGTAENGTLTDGTDKPYTLWFTGFAPAESPKVVVGVVVENGGGMGLEGTSEGIAAPIGKKVIEAVLNQ